MMQYISWLDKTKHPCMSPALHQFYSAAAFVLMLPHLCTDAEVLTATYSCLFYYPLALALAFAISLFLDGGPCPQCVTTGCVRDPSKAPVGV